MRIFPLVCFLFPLAFIFSACGEDQSPIQTESKVQPQAAVSLDDRPKIIAFGDSLTSGFGLADRRNAYPALMQAALDNEGYRFQVLNYGYGGDTTQRGLARLYLATGITTSQIFVVELGANDVAHRVPVETIEGNLRQLISTLRNLEKTVLLCGIRAPKGIDPEYAADIERMYTELSREFGVQLMPDFMEGVSGNSEHLLPDGIHPNEAGARVIAENVFRELRPLLSQNEKE